MEYGECILPWRKSSRSGGGLTGNDECVQVTVVLLRD